MADPQTRDLEAARPKDFTTVPPQNNPNNHNEQPGRASILNNGARPQAPHNNAIVAPAPRNIGAARQRPQDNGGGSSTNSEPRDGNSKLRDSLRVARGQVLYKDDGNRVINLATVHRTILLDLQVKIAEQIGKANLNAEQQGADFNENELMNAMLFYGTRTSQLPSKVSLTSTTAQYVRDWETMLKYADNKSLADPFCITDREGVINDTMNSNNFPKRDDLILGTRNDSYVRAMFAKIGPFQQRNRVRHSIKSKALWYRFFMAIIGGIALIVPMVLMSKLPAEKRGTNADLITTSVATVIVGILVALFSDSPPEGVIAIVAAYAAVLVVFVGTTLDKKT
jgi:hypothetical protein